MRKLTFDEVNAYDRFHLRFAQGKLTYLGVQTEPVASVLFSAYTVAPRVELFLPLRSPGLHYGNDALAVTSNFTCTHEDFRRVLDLLAETPAVRGPPAREPHTSLAIIPDVREAAGFEAVLDHGAAGRLLSGMRKIFAATVPLGARLLEEFQSGG